jgi:hypothetical protein
MTLAREGTSFVRPRLRALLATKTRASLMACRAPILRKPNVRDLRSSCRGQSSATSRRPGGRFRR